MSFSCSAREQHLGGRLHGRVAGGQACPTPRRAPLQGPAHKSQRQWNQNCEYKLDFLQKMSKPYLLPPPWLVFWFLVAGFNWRGVKSISQFKFVLVGSMMSTCLTITLFINARNCIFFSTCFPPVRSFLPLISAPTGFHDWGLVTRRAQLLITSNYITYPAQRKI